jgi:RNA polymerase sigma-70 factor (ECF subfamily)
MSSDIGAYFPKALAKVADVQISASVSQLAVFPSISESAKYLAISGSEAQCSDEDLLVQIGNGNKDALSILFQRYARPVFSVPQRILKDVSEAEDLRQEVFLYVFQKAALFDAGKGSAASWIMQVTYHRAFNRRKHLNVRQHYNIEEVNDERLHVANAQSSIDQLAGRQLLNQLREHLSAEQLQALELHFFEGYDFREIAEKTGQTLGNVRNHYYRGLERLRSHVFPHKRV